MNDPAPAIRAAEPDIYPSVYRAWSSVAIMFVLLILSGLDRNIMALLVNEMKADLALNEVQIGTLIGAAYALFYSVGALPLGWALDRFDRRVVIWFGVTLWSLGTMGCGLARGYWSMFAARAIVGGGEAALMPGASSLLPDMFPKHRLGLAMSILSLGVKVGTGVSLIAGGALALLFVPAQSYHVPLAGMMKGWHLIFLVAGAPGLLLALAVFAIPSVGRRARAKAGTASIATQTTYRDYGRFVWRHRRFFAGHHLGILPITLTTMGLAAWMPSFYMRIHHLPTDQAGLWMGVAVSLGPIIALPMHGWLADRLFQRGMKDAHLRYLIACIMLSVPALAISLLAGSVVVSLVFLCAFYALSCGYISLPAVVLQLVVPTDLRGKVFSMTVMISGVLAVGTGPVLVAWITTMLGGPAMVAYSLLICLLVGFPLSVILYSLALRPLRTMLSAT